MGLHCCHCDAPLDLESCELAITTEGSIAACTFPCLYLWVRAQREKCEANIEPDLLAVVAYDLFVELSDHMEDLDKRLEDAQATRLIAAFERFGGVINMLNLSPEYPSIDMQQ